MTAALPMYSRPETRAAEARLWSLMLEHGWQNSDTAPRKLLSPPDLRAFWADPELIFAQTCGMPYRLMENRPSLLGAPIHPISLPAGQYQSVVIVAAEANQKDIAGFSTACLAMNEPQSQSGWAAAWDVGLGRGEILKTGSHRASAIAVAEARAVVATIDCVTWSMIERWDPDLRHCLSVVGTTPLRPALPFVTRIGDVTGLREALRHAIASLSHADRSTLCLWGLADVDEQTYLAVPNPPAPQSS